MECLQNNDILLGFRLCLESMENFITLTMQKCWYQELARVFSNGAEESAISDNDSEKEAFEVYTEEDVMNADKRHKKFLKEMGIEDEYQWTHIDANCIIYECLKDTDIVKNALNASANESVAENISNKDNDPPPTQRS